MPPSPVAASTQSSPTARTSRASTSSAGHPASRRRSAAGVTRIPASASRIAAGGSPLSTRSSRGSSSVVSSPADARMNTGGPIGAIASSRIRSGAARPAISRTRSRCPAARPDRPISAVSVRKAAQWPSASARIDVASATGVPAPVGKATRFGAQPAAATAQDRTRIAAITRGAAAGPARRIRNAWLRRPPAFPRGHREACPSRARSSMR